MHEFTDFDLLSRWLGGDSEAFAVLAVRHHGLVAAACRRQAPPGESEDCVQAVFLLLMRKPAAAARAPALEAWLQRVTYFVCRTAQRSARRRRHSELSASTPVLAEAPLANEALEHLDACLLKLPDRQRTAITLHHLAGKSAEEVACTLGITRDHAYQLISRGLAALRTHLTRRGIRVGSVVLASWLATEARAATMPVDLEEMHFQPSTVPTAPAEYLAQGALHAMNVTSFIPAASAAGLLLAAGILTWIFTAEPSPPRTPVGSTAPAAGIASAKLQKAAPTMPVEPLSDILVQASQPDFPLERLNRARADGRTLHMDSRIIGASPAFWTAMGIANDQPQHLTQIEVERILAESAATVVDHPALITFPLQLAQASFMTESPYIKDYDLSINPPSPLVSIFRIGNAVDVCAEARDGGFLVAKAHAAMVSLLGIERSTFTVPIHGLDQTLIVEAPKLLVTETGVASEIPLAADETLALPFNHIRLQQGTSSLSDTKAQRTVEKIPDPQITQVYFLFISVTLANAQGNPQSKPAYANKRSDF